MNEHTFQIEYHPMETQRAFHNSNAKIRIYSGAFRAGKTLAGCHESIKIALKYPGVVGAICRLTNPDLRRTTRKTFFECIESYQKKLPQGIFIGDEQFGVSDGIRGFRKGDNEYQFVNGSRILFMHTENALRLGSLELGFFFIDEAVEVDEDVYTMLVGRLSQPIGPRIGFLVSNPDSEHHWLYKKFNSSHVEVFYANTYENIHLPSDYTQTLELDYDDDEQTRYLHGKWGSFKGRIYKEFDGGNIKEFDIDPQWDKYIGVDLGVVHATALIGIYHDTINDIIYINWEFHETNIDSNEIIEELTRRDIQRDHVIAVDPSCKDAIMRMRKAGLNAISANNSVNEGIRVVKSYLKGKCFIHPRCVKLIKELSSYRYKKTEEKPVKHDDDGVDAMRYGIMEVVKDAASCEVVGDIGGIF